VSVEMNPIISENPALLTSVNFKPKPNLINSAFVDE
jgi:hypothetical protein